MNQDPKPVPDAAQAPLQPLRLAVVGHTNTGKTSLLRTLARDPGFGEIHDRPGTTRQVQGARLLMEGQAVIELFDTPGIEDGIGLLDYLDQLTQRGERLDGLDRIQRFLDTPESQGRFEQEARVLRKLIDCDAGIYVVDVRDPVLAKHKDELTILASCGRPLLPVLNFIHNSHGQAEAWRSALARLGLHASAEFDTVAPALDGEAQLYDKLALLLDTHSRRIKALKHDIARQRQIRRDDALGLIAELLVDAAALHMPSKADSVAIAQVTETLRDKIRQREQRCVNDLLKRYNFRREDLASASLPLQGERWGMDLFHPQALRQMGIHVGTGMAAGAMAGVTVDLFTAGLSLGAAALVGATAGGLWQGAERFGKRIMGRLQGFQELSVDDGVLRLLALRQLALLDALERRGHAAQGPITLQAPDPSNESKTPHGHAPAADDADGTRNSIWRQGKLPAELLEARSQPQWSNLASEYESDTRRDQVVTSLTQTLRAH